MKLADRVYWVWIVCLAIATGELSRRDTPLPIIVGVAWAGSKAMAKLLTWGLGDDNDQMV